MSVIVRRQREGERQKRCRTNECRSVDLQNGRGLAEDLPVNPHYDCPVHFKTGNARFSETCQLICDL